MTQLVRASVGDAVAPSSRLFSPIRIGSRIDLPNRFMMQPLYLNMETELNLYSDEHMASLAAFFGERAYYGAKLSVVGGLGVSKMGRWRKDAMMLGTLDASAAMRHVTTAVHREKGYVLAQAWHGGRSCRKRWSFSSTSAPSTVQPYPDAHPFRVPGCLVNYIASEYQRFAKLAEEAGFDGVEIPVSEGTLLHNFLSPAINTRTDAFGGPLANRLEFTLRVLERLKDSLSQEKKDFVVSLRLCLHDLREGGMPMEDTLQVAAALARSGYIDLLNTSVGMHDSPVQTMSSYVPHGTFSGACKKVKTHFSEKDIAIPVVASHGLHSPRLAERMLAQNVCDMIGIARPLLADPQFIDKASKGEEEDILPCIGCNHCVNRLYKHQRITCALNPIAGYELERQWAPAKYRKSVAVVGAGPAGVTAALTLWRRGHDVTLFEKDSCIGGQLNLAKVVPGKERYQDVLEYWTRQLRQSSINVRLNTTFCKDEVTRNHQFFHAVVMAHGSIPRPITSHVFPGASECPLIVPFRRILDGSVKAGRRVVIVGNGATSHDVASYLLHDSQVSRDPLYYLDEWGVQLTEGTMLPDARSRVPRNNREVTIFNKADKDADLSRGWGWSQKLWIRNHDGSIIKHGMIESFTKTGVKISILPPDCRTFVVPCDTIVWCIGMLPNITYGTWIYEWMWDGAKARGEMLKDFSIYTVGSCRDSVTGDGHGEQDMLQAVHEGYEVGFKI